MFPFLAPLEKLELREDVLDDRERPSCLLEAIILMCVDTCDEASM